MSKIDEILNTATLGDNPETSVDEDLLDSQFDYKKELAGAWDISLQYQFGIQIFYNRSEINEQQLIHRLNYVLEQTTIENSRVILIDDDYIDGTTGPYSGTYDNKLMILYNMTDNFVKYLSLLQAVKKALPKDKQCGIHQIREAQCVTTRSDENHKFLHKRECCKYPENEELDTCLGYWYGHFGEDSEAQETFELHYKIFKRMFDMAPQ